MLIRLQKKTLGAIGSTLVALGVVGLLGTVGVGDYEYAMSRQGIAVAITPAWHLVGMVVIGAFCIFGGWFLTKKS